MPGGQPPRPRQSAGCLHRPRPGGRYAHRCIRLLRRRTSWRSLGGLQDSANGRDPTVTFDASGRGYVCANTDDLHIWRTDDGGRTFAVPVLATRGHKLDHPWLAADPAPGPPSSTHLYGAWTGGGQHPAGVRPLGRRRPQLPAPRVIDTVRGPGANSPPRWSRPAMTAPSMSSTACGRCFPRRCRGRSSPPRSGSSLHRPRPDLGPAGRAGDRGDGDPGPAGHQRAGPAHGRGPQLPGPGRGRVRGAPAGRTLHQHRGVPLP